MRRSHFVTFALFGGGEPLIRPVLVRTRRRMAAALSVLDKREVTEVA